MELHGTRSVCGNSDWYWVVLGQYKSVFGATGVSIRPLCLYTLKRVENLSGFTDALLTDRQ